MKLIADPDERVLLIYDSAGNYECVKASVELYAPAVFPDLRLPLRALFAKTDIPGDVRTHRPLSITPESRLG